MRSSSSISKGLRRRSAVCSPMRCSSQSWLPVMTMMGVCLVLLCPRSILKREAPSRLGRPTSNKMRCAPRSGSEDLASCPSEKMRSRQLPARSSISWNILARFASSSTIAINLFTFAAFVCLIACSRPSERDSLEMRPCNDALLGPLSRPPTLLRSYLRSGGLKGVV